MSIVEPPPDWKANIILGAHNLVSGGFEKFETPAFLDFVQKANDEYFYWSDLRYRVPSDLGVKAEEAWGYLKLARKANRKSTPIQDKEGQPFTYWIPDSLYRDISEVDKWATGQIITDQPFSLPSRERYIINSLMDEAIASSQLEGASTEYKIAKAMLRSGRKPNNKSEQMIVNNWKAMQYIRKNIKTNFSLDAIYELHTILTQDTLDHPEDSGRLRQNDDIAVNYRGETVFIPPRAETLKDRMISLCEFANSDDESHWIHPVVKGAMIHFWLAYNHPFIDGNGRTARALMYWYLLNRGYELFQYLSISKHFVSTPGQYVRAYLYTEYDENDLTYFLFFNLSAVHFALGELRKYLTDKQEEISRANQLLNNSRGLGLRQKSLIYHSLQHPDAVYTIEAHKNTHGIAYETARKDLMTLVSKGFLRMQKEGKRLLLFFPTGKAMEKLKER